MPNISQKEFELLLADLQKTADKERPVPLATLLLMRGFSRNLENINFSIEGKTMSFFAIEKKDGSLSTATQVPRYKNVLKNLDFSGCKIKNCCFDYCDLSGARLKDISIEGCSFSHTLLNHSFISHTAFKNSTEQACVFNNTSFDYSTIADTGFYHLYCTDSTFHHLQAMERTQFIDCEIQNTSIIGVETGKGISIASTEESSIEDFHTDAVINFHKVRSENDKPVILLSWNNQLPGVSATLVEKMLMAHQLVPLRMDYNPMVNALP